MKTTINITNQILNHAFNQKHHVNILSATSNPNDLIGSYQGKELKIKHLAAYIALQQSESSIPVNEEKSLEKLYRAFYKTPDEIITFLEHTYNTLMNEVIQMN